MRGEPRVLASPTSVIANEVKRLLRKQPTYTCKSIIWHKEILTTASLREVGTTSWCAFANSKFTRFELQIYNLDCL